MLENTLKPPCNDRAQVILFCIFPFSGMTFLKQIQKHMNTAVDPNGYVLMDCMWPTPVTGGALISCVAPINTSFCNSNSQME